MRRAQFLTPRFQLGLLRECAFLFRLELLSRFFQLLPHFFQLGLQFPPMLPNVARLLLSAFTRPGLFGERFRQSLDLLRDLGLRCLQLLYPFFELDLLGK